MGTTPSQQIIAYLKALPQLQCVALVDSINSRIKDTGRRAIAPNDLPMTALARRLYLYALKLGMPEDTTGLPVPQYGAVKDELTEFCQTIKLAGVKPPEDKDVDNFCGLKVRVRGSTREGFYFLVALFILKKEEEKFFNDAFFPSAIPTSEIKLGQDIQVFLARALNADAEGKRKTQPFPAIKPARPASDLPQITARYLHHKIHGELADRFFQEYRLEEDGRAHLIVYRSRRSKPAELIKSFIVIEPVIQKSTGKNLGYHPTVHFYQAPIDAGRTRRVSPGRIVPLDTGIYILGGQRAEALRDVKAPPLREELPFRTIELLFFPWSALEGAHLFSGLMFASNNDGAPLVSRICARPTLISRSDNEKMQFGAIKLDGLTASLERDRDAELAMDVDSEAASKFLSVYDEYGSVDDLAARIAAACNNGPFEGEWAVAPAFQKGARAFDKKAMERALHDADPFQGVMLSGEEGRAFDLWSDVRFPPLTLE